MESDRFWRVDADYHTHTVYSHGRGTIEDNINAARGKGIKIIGISDHGPGHKGFGIKRDDIFKMRQDVDMLNKAYKDIEVKLGLEANISMTDGSLDVDSEIIQSLDYLMAGYHFGTVDRPILTSAKIHFYNYLSEHSNSIERRVRIINTKAFIRAMENYDLLAVTHPGAKGPLFMDEVIKAAIDSDVLLEINNKHGHLSTEEIRLAGNMGADFIVGSDAHRPEDVGIVASAVDRIEKSGVDAECIYNMTYLGKEAF